MISCTIGMTSSPQYADLMSKVYTKVPADTPLIDKELGKSYRASDPEGVARWLKMGRLNVPEVAARQRARRSSRAATVDPTHG